MQTAALLTLPVGMGPMSLLGARALATPDNSGVSLLGLCLSSDCSRRSNCLTDSTATIGLWAQNHNADCFLSCCMFMRGLGFGPLATFRKMQAARMHTCLSAGSIRCQLLLPFSALWVFCQMETAVEASCMDCTSTLRLVSQVGQHAAQAHKWARWALKAPPASSP